MGKKKFIYHYVDFSSSNNFYDNALEDFKQNNPHWFPPNWSTFVSLNLVVHTAATGVLLKVKWHLVTSTHISPMVFHLSQNKIKVFTMAYKALHNLAPNSYFSAVKSYYFSPSHMLSSHRGLFLVSHHLRTSVLIRLQKEFSPRPI